MQASGCTPDVVTYTSLISAYERGGQWHLALAAFERMVAQGCRADAIVYNAIIDALWQTGVVWAQVLGEAGSVSVSCTAAGAAGVSVSCTRSRAPASGRLRCSRSIHTRLIPSAGAHSPPSAAPPG